MRCVDSLPESDLRRVAAFLVSDAADSSALLAQPGNLLVETVAGKVRSLLGAAHDQLPLGEPAVTRRGVDGSVIITLHRDGSFAGAADNVGSDSVHGAGIRLIERAITALSADRERVFWPDALKGDSIRFRISIAAPFPEKDGTAGDVETSFASPVFTLALPWGEHVSVKKLSRPVYPLLPIQGMSEGFVVIQFRVDEKGEVDPATIKDLRPPGSPPMLGPLTEYYRQFVNAAKSSITKSQYRPARVGGCSIPEVVRQPFQFSLSNH